MYKKQLYALDVLLRKLCRSNCNTGRSLEWHEIFHHWNDRARTFARAAGVKFWSCCVCRQHWKLASCNANLPEHRWARTILAWKPSVRHRWLGKRAHVGLSSQNFFCRYKGWKPWLQETKIPPSLDCTLWIFFCTFCRM